MKTLEPVTLTGRFVRLESLREEHHDGVQHSANDPRLWEVTVVRAYGEHFESWWEDAIRTMHHGTRMPFAVISQADGSIVGSTSYLNVALGEERLEIGSTFYARSHWATKINPECKLLLMSHAFETLGIRRVEYCVDAINSRSRSAVTRLGAKEEGILRSHRYTYNGRRRDTVMFSIIDSEWPAVKRGLEARLDQ